MKILPAFAVFFLSLGLFLAATGSAAAYWGYQQPYFASTYPQYQYGYNGYPTQSRSPIYVPPFEWHAAGNLPWYTSPNQYGNSSSYGYPTYASYGGYGGSNQASVYVPPFEWRASGNLPWYISGNTYGCSYYSPCRY